jgi:hypothetical protein
VPAGTSVAELREAAIDSGLKWLVDHQDKDGGWTFKLGPDPGQQESRNGATGLAVLALARAGYGPKTGKYAAQVMKGLQFLGQHQHPTGSWHEKGGTMYSHALATLAFLETAALTDDTRFMSPARLGVRFTLAAQDPKGGGWRYTPQETGDLSVTGWQVKVLRRFYELNPPDKQIVVKALDATRKTFLPQVQADGGEKYRYLKPSDKPTESLSAVGAATALGVGVPPDDPILIEVADRLAARLEVNESYGNYYLAQFLRSIDHSQRRDWDEKIVRALVARQEPRDDVDHAGSWEPVSAQLLGAHGGRLGYTGFNLLILLANRETP